MPAYYNATDDTFCAWSEDGDQNRALREAILSAAKVLLTDDFSWRVVNVNGDSSGVMVGIRCHVPTISLGSFDDPDVLEEEIENAQDVKEFDVPDPLDIDWRVPGSDIALPGARLTSNRFVLILKNDGKCSMSLTGTLTDKGAIKSSESEGGNYYLYGQLRNSSGGPVGKRYHIGSTQYLKCSSRRAATFGNNGVNPNHFPVARGVVITSEFNGWFDYCEK